MSGVFKVGDKESMMKKLLSMGLLALLLPTVSALAEDPVVPSPDTIVKQMVGEVVSSIKQNRNITHDLKKMDGLVDAKIFPYFDFFHMARLVVGSKYWADATPQDQQQLTGEFRIFLVHTFSNAIAQYTNQEIFFTPLHIQPKDKDITVRTTIKDPGDEATELNYQLAKTASGWMIYNVDVDGIGVIGIYRLNFTTTLLQGGVPNLISVLHKKNQEVEASRHG